MLRLNGLRAGYRDEPVVRDISIEVPPGRVVCLIGTNGAGKTTTLKAAVGLARMMGGEVLVGEAGAVAPDPARMLAAGVTMVPEGRGVLSGLTVHENLLVGGHTVRGRGEVEARLGRVYEMFPKLRERAGISAALLSGGEQQMLAIGRALMSQPRYLLLDEPTMGLSPLLVEFVASLARDLAAEGIGVLLAEQNAQMALNVADWGYVIEQGAIAVEGSSGDLRDNHQVQVAYLGWEE